MAKKARRRSSDAPRAPRAARTGSRGVATMPFDRLNYVLLLGAVGLVVLGYALMLIDNATNDNPVDSVMSLFIAPLLLLSGYVGVAVAVLWGAPRDAGAAGLTVADATAPVGTAPKAVKVNAVKVTDEAARVDPK